MADYRCYPITRSGSIAGPSQVVRCVDDSAAIAKAREVMLSEQAFEVWQGSRRVYVSKEVAEESATL